MSVPFILLSVIYIIACVALITVILMQKKRSAGLGGMSGMGGDTQTYWDKNKGRSLEGALENYSKILAGVLMVLSLVLCLIK